MRHSLGATLLVTLVALAPIACGRKEPPPSPAPAATTPAEAPPRATDDDAAERARREAEAARLRAAEAERTRALLEAPVHFDYDQSEIRADARETLDAKVPPLRDAPSARLRIEGHADERGSVEYNMALGMRRAEAARQYLVGFGIDGARLETVSAGEERPVDPGHDEEAWARNRRAEFTVLGGLPIAERR